MNTKRIAWTVAKIFSITFILPHIWVLVFGIQGLPMNYKVIDYIWIFCITLILLKKYIEIEVLKRKNQRLNNEAYIDFHTGLPNRNSCEKLLSRYGNLDESKYYGAIMFDLNNLKVINDTFGHKIGDELIRNFAFILKNNASDRIFVGRYGGDEFIALFLNGNKDQMDRFVKGILKDVTLFNSVKREYKISYSCGYSSCSDINELSLKDILDVADKNMYEEKSSIKRRVKKMA